jgi:hypothetical protein
VAAAAVLGRARGEVDAAVSVEDAGRGRGRADPTCVELRCVGEWPRAAGDEDAGREDGERIEKEEVGREREEERREDGLG